MGATLTLHNVCKTFGSTKIVDDVSFAVNEGEIFGLLGPNGAGKTTTIRCILGIIYPDDGSINFSFGSAIRLARNSIGYLPEERGLYKDVRVMDVLLYLANLRDYSLPRARQRALYYLEKFGLQGREKAKIEELSKGMAQKVQLIAAILHEPKLLILDEPFSGLDPVSQNILKQELRELTAQGTAILLSGHQMNVLEELCDRIFMMHKGRQVIYGHIDQVKEQYADHKCTIYGANEGVPFEQLRGAKHVERDKHRTTIFLEKDVEVQEFLHSLPSTAEIKELRIDRISLHDIFVSVAQGGVENEG